MNEITFDVAPCRETGGYVALWVGGYFEPKDRPKRCRIDVSRFNI